MVRPPRRRGRRRRPRRQRALPSTSSEGVAVGGGIGRLYPLIRRLRMCVVCAMSVLIMHACLLSPVCHKPHPTCLRSRTPSSTSVKSHVQHVHNHPHVYGSRPRQCTSVTVSLVMHEPRSSHHVHKSQTSSTYMSTITSLVLQSALTVTHAGLQRTHAQTLCRLQ
ncbi:hypothetical protein BD626DRAFT_477287 [Schizophyllum amplum]|uniref:Uncharacterized protein n=1 Tax=Schizophyllum amplum TaxID=97359 RepID=A0A550D022_9AGAR|nr:hypothetical protein BD626DRAFT_477287 [Auriculariopsis ampla]